MRVRIGKTEQRETEGAPKFPSSLEEGLSTRSLYDPRAVAGARLRGRCFRVTRTTPKSVYVRAYLRAWFERRPRCRISHLRGDKRGILPVERSRTRVNGGNRRRRRRRKKKGGGAEAEKRKEGRKERRKEGKKERKKKEGWTSDDRYRSRHHPVDKGCSPETAKSGFVGFAGTRYTWPRFASFHASTQRPPTFPNSEKRKGKRDKRARRRKKERLVGRAGRGIKLPSNLYTMRR